MSVFAGLGDSWSESQDSHPGFPSRTQTVEGNFIQTLENTPFSGVFMMPCWCLAMTHFCPKCQVRQVMANHRSISILRMARATEGPHPSDPGVPTKDPSRTSTVLILAGGARPLEPTSLNTPCGEEGTVCILGEAAASGGHIGQWKNKRKIQAPLFSGTSVH